MRPLTSPPSALPSIDGVKLSSVIFSFEDPSIDLLTSFSCSAVKSSFRGSKSPIPSVAPIFLATSPADAISLSLLNSLTDSIKSLFNFVTFASDSSIVSRIFYHPHENQNV